MSHRIEHTSRTSAAILGTALILLGSLLAAASPAAASTTITSSGRIGPLRLDRSDESQIVAFAGEPEVEGASIGEFPGTSGWDALGYGGCKPTDTTDPPVAPTGPDGPYCRTVFYLNNETGRLGTFFTSSPSFRDAHGVRAGTRTAKAARLEHARALQGCLSGIAITTPTAYLHLVIQGGHPHKSGNRLLIRGGRIGALVLHSRTHDVGAFDCW